jgi:hypothetical protein
MESDPASSQSEATQMKFIAICAKAAIPCFLLMVAVYMAPADSPSVTVRGYVLDSACAFTKDLSKPISKQCATSCANAGSQLVILAEDGTIYWPIAATTPSSGQNPKLLPFAADKVIVTGKVYQRGGSKAIVIDKIEAQSPQK